MKGLLLAITVLFEPVVYINVFSLELEAAVSIEPAVLWILKE
jgi:hypothetical protein